MTSGRHTPGSLLRVPRPAYGARSSDTGSSRPRGLRRPGTGIATDHRPWPRATAGGIDDAARSPMQGGPEVAARPGFRTAGLHGHVGRGRGRHIGGSGSPRRRQAPYVVRVTHPKKCQSLSGTPSTAPTRVSNVPGRNRALQSASTGHEHGGVQDVYPAGPTSKRPHRPAQVSTVTPSREADSIVRSVTRPPRPQCTRCRDSACRQAGCPAGSGTSPDAGTPGTTHQAAAGCRR